MTAFLSHAQKRTQADEQDEDFFSLLPSYSISQQNIKDSLTSETNLQASFDFSEENQKAKLIKAKMDTILASYQNIKLAQGYRVQVYFGTSKDEVRRAKEAVYAILPEVEIHTTYKQPDYRVKVGDFLTKVEAFSCLGKVEKVFPNALIVPDVVNLKK